MKHFKVTFLIAVFFCMLAVSCKKSNEPIGTDDLPAFNTCVPVSPAGGLTSAGLHGPFVYKTSGGGTITIDLSKYIIFGLDDYLGFTVEFWGGLDASHVSFNHENMNGTHLKDRIAGRRTILFPDKTKLTLVAEGDKGQLQSITIYDGPQCHRINGLCGILEYSANDQKITKAIDENEADGETGTFEYTATGLLFLNVYQEDARGKKVAERKLIGEIYRADPGKVNDYWP